MKIYSDNVRIVIKDYDNLIHIHVLMNGIKIGYLYLTRVTKERIKLADILVYDHYQGLGFGNKLIKEAIKLAQERGVKEIYGTMLGDTDMLTYFYRKHNFEIHDSELSLSL
ncbi:GNAT family N-acetyltransferase [Klebsiella oxytoca]|uniref:GNAT family N-acetyltransferase n=1 Tax=Klebsiella oxytoca TaxID=571 RepID=UPI002549EE2F|nr:GNAT family N-acetyltransferase [Klebsiella oxytoca]MEC5509951.1 GNAT family N-acetyltransferase [Klebsiella oxytoca]